jgi:hypothetical protein
MTKTQATRNLERAIWQYTHASGKQIYGAFEVTVGYIAFRRDGYDRADYVTMATDGTIRAYELKTSVSDFRSPAILSWIGHYNYLVLTDAVYREVKEELPMNVGVLVADEAGNIRSEYKSGYHQHSIGECTEIMESMLKAAARDAAKYYMQEDGRIAN